ncbi:hypothetical protein [Frankia sp. CiP3]|uniref:hypothetical protein n=1 Tax=Frankia sp. CiP3 TaxID=2880971 RepID=UPI001EF51EDE|nr:hypothetical protein [Frankia sp. CiP3]
MVDTHRKGDPSPPLAALNEAHRAQALRRWRILRPLVEDGIPLRGRPATLLAQVLLDAQASVASRRAVALGDLVRTQGTYAAAAAVLAEIGQELADEQLAATTPEAVGQTIRRARTPRRASRPGSGA